MLCRKRRLPISSAYPQSKPFELLCTSRHVLQISRLYYHPDFRADRFSLRSTRATRISPWENRGRAGRRAFPRVEFYTGYLLKAGSAICPDSRMIYDQALMSAACRAFAERIMAPERVDGAVGWIMSRAERDPRLRKALMERAVSPLRAEGSLFLGRVTP
jgi:hypothetical protein